MAERNIELATFEMERDPEDEFLYYQGGMFNRALPPFGRTQQLHQQRPPVRNERYWDNLDVLNEEEEAEPEALD